MQSQIRPQLSAQFIGTVIFTGLFLTSISVSSAGMTERRQVRMGNLSGNQIELLTVTKAEKVCSVRRADYEKSGYQTSINEIIWVDIRKDDSQRAVCVLIPKSVAAKLGQKSSSVSR